MPAFPSFSQRAGRLLDSAVVPYTAAAASLALGLFFTFVWAPHPWDWRGIDQYHNLARDLARGEPFGTTDVPWGYAYFVAAFYRLFGEHEWLPILAQVVANAAIPLMLYRLALPLAGRRVAALAAGLTGVLSFNTIYASTQASDAICTVLFVAATWAFVRGSLVPGAAMFALAGLLAGLVPQFRPNLVLLPWLVAAGYVAWPARSWRKAAHMAVFLAVVSLALTPWVARNYRLTGRFLPTSTHGAVQLWYGSLQVGPYLESRARNPRSVFEAPAFDYTSLGDTTILVSASLDGCPVDAQPALTYWTDRDPRPTTVRATARRADTLDFELPGQPLPTTLYYRVASSAQATTAAPRVFFVSDDHLGDLDRHGDMLDIFDVVRVLRHLAWGEELPHADRLDLTGDGVVDTADLDAIVTRMLSHALALQGLDVTPAAATLTFVDGSELSVPFTFSGRLSDVALDAGLAARLLDARVSFAGLSDTAPADDGSCLTAAQVGVNQIYYRREVHQMQRYLALALDNITQEPGAFAAAAAYRAVRLFVIRSTDDPAAVYQFAWSRAVYAVGMLASTAYLLLFVSGVVFAWRRRSALLFLLLPIVYIPATICFVLTNQRYTVTVQPLMFLFMAVAVVAALRLEAPDEGAAEDAGGAPPARC
ncbi:MAG: glycosyltransferase family 39 protein [Vicinamibacterales bacterium]|nr:glycosyltransferase family 39 protein [Vicinamibacterales bacterium]